MKRNKPWVVDLSALGKETCYKEAEPLWPKTCRIIADCLHGYHREPELPSDEELLRQAHRELMDAQSRFSGVEDPELIDSAIYALKAAEMRYDYLIRRIKQQRAVRC